jgi:hypothetical protein
MKQRNGFSKQECRGQSPLPHTSEVAHTTQNSSKQECRGQGPLPGSGVSPDSSLSSPPQAAQEERSQFLINLKKWE